MNTIRIFIFLLFTATFHAQAIEGTIKDQNTGETLPYVNIGIVGKNVGTVSSENGTFNISISEQYNSDAVKLSMLGYEDLQIKVSDLRQQLEKNNAILLKPVQIQLREVVVSKRKLKEKVLGNTTESDNTTAGFTSNKLGNEIGIVIKIKRAPTHIKDFTASVPLTQDHPIKLRLNFYSLKNGLPDKLLQNENIIVTSPVVKGKIKVDLTPYNLYVEDDFFVSLEWIENGPGHGIQFSASLLGSPMIVRNTSQANWEKVGIVGVGFTVTAEY